MTTAIEQIETQARRGDVRAQVEFGLALEAAGRAHEGMEWLSLAARGGSAEALALVGVRLVAGRYGPGLAQRGIGLLQDAARMGSAGAIRRLAALCALGLHQPANWPRALDLLGRAAELGGEEARIELAILARAQDPLDRADDADGCRRLRESIDLRSWLEPPASESLCASPKVRAFAAFASPSACAWMISQAQPRLVQAEVYDPGAGRNITSPDRNNRVANFDLETTNLVVIAIQQALAACLGADLARSEAGSVLCYEPGQQASEHFDSLDPATPSSAREIEREGQRIATGLVYLNEDYEDGATSFPRLGIDYKGRTGSALVFDNVGPDGRPEPRSLHAGRPPRGGSKWVLSCFVRDRTLRVPRLGG